MRNLVPSAPNGGLPLPEFAPVPRRKRLGGWTVERQRAFIEALADTGSVTDAAKRVNMTTEGAYYLRRAAGAEGFRAAWEAAIEHGVEQLADLAIDRARNGVAVPVYWRDRQIGEKRWYDNRLLMFVLKHHMPNKYGADLRKGGSVSPHQQQIEWRERQAQREADVAKMRKGWRAIRAGFVRSIADDPAKRAAWELLTGATPDWGDPEAPMPPCGDLPDVNHNRPDMIIPTAALKLDEQS